MRLLVLGGTGWLGREVAGVAVAAGHDVVCLARGRAGAAADGARLVVADRSQADAYERVSAERWDAVVDVTDQPGWARQAVDALADRVGHWVYVSSCSVYADHAVVGADETAPLLPALTAHVMASPEQFGEAKVACERAVVDGVGAHRSAVVRAGLIGGAGDTSDRTGYWPMRFAHPAADDGAVLVPAADVAMQLIDVRDLAAWIVALAAGARPGTFNATGPAAPLTEILDAARRAGGHGGELVAVDQEWLTAHQVGPWAGPRSLPLWLPVPDYAGFGARDASAAVAAGLHARPLVETFTSALRWEEELGVGRPRGAGLTDDEERELLAAARP